MRGRGWDDLPYACWGAGQRRGHIGRAAVATCKAVAACSHRQACLMAQVGGAVVAS
jgi:hypothetical protein